MTIIFALVAAFSMLITAFMPTALYAQQDNKDFYVQVESPDGTIEEDVADTKQQCKSLEDSYESQGYTIIQKCHPGPNLG